MFSWLRCQAGPRRGSRRHGYRHIQVVGHAAHTPTIVVVNLGFLRVRQGPEPYLAIQPTAARTQAGEAATVEAGACAKRTGQLHHVFLTVAGHDAGHRRLHGRAAKRTDGRTSQTLALAFVAVINLVQTRRQLPLSNCWAPSSFSLTPNTVTGIAFPIRIWVVLHDPTVPRQSPCKWPSPLRRPAKWLGLPPFGLVHGARHSPGAAPRRP